MFFSRRVVLLLTSFMFIHSAVADQILLDDGSLLKGTIKQIANNSLTMQTGFAGEIKIDLERVKQLKTDDKRFVQLESGDRIAGRLIVNESGRQQLTDTAFGTINLDMSRINGLWSLDERRPIAEKLEQKHRAEVAELKSSHEHKVKQIKSDYEKDIEQLEQRQQELENPWFGNVAFGLQGASGNTERFGMQGRGELYRETNFDRLAIYMEGNYQEESGNETVNEVLAGARLEHDFTDRWFAFGNMDFETDEFENLDLRAIATTGIGYFFVRKPEFQFKGRAGVGYQYEGFSDGTTNEEPLGQLGYDLVYQANGWLKLLHDLTYYPTFTDPGADYRVVANLGGEMPLSENEAWKLRANVRNQYDSLPAAGVKNNDTTYLLNLVYDWK